MRWLQSVWLCLPLSLALSGQPEPRGPGDPGAPHCGPEGFLFTGNLSLEAAAPPALVAWAWDRLPCAPSPSTRGDCERLGCCYDAEEENPCYYGNTVTSHCTQDGHFSIAVSRNVTSPPLLLNSVHLAFRNDSECEPVMVTHTFVLFQFPVTACGTTKQHLCSIRGHLGGRVTGNQAVYENELVATRDVRTWSQGSITRDSVFRLRVGCSYSVSSSAFPASIQVLTLPPPLPEAQPGPLTMELRIAKAVLGHPRRERPAPAPVAPAGSPPACRCPYAGDNYRTRLVPVREAPGLPLPSHHQRFSISTFSFVDSVSKQALKGPPGCSRRAGLWVLLRAALDASGASGACQLALVSRGFCEISFIHQSSDNFLSFFLGEMKQVYLHCSAAVCQPAGAAPCRVTCPAARRRRRSEGPLQNSTACISSEGPMILLQATRDPAEELRKYSGSPVDARALWVAGLSGTVIVGAALGALSASCLAIRKWR
ncbi:zona pellucida sperm-binding protein 4 precursor [Camelus ferus]|nr:zona pellucida sperm-binding protein 4 precursor [Camelus ferus]